MNCSMDKIVLKNMVFYGYHGVLAEERRLGQSFTVSLDIYLSLEKAGLKDSLADTVDYSKIYNEVREIMEGEPVKLIETLAHGISSMVLEYALVKGVYTCVQKSHPPIPGVNGGVEVCLYRERE